MPTPLGMPPGWARNVDANENGVRSVTWKRESRENNNANAEPTKRSFLSPGTISQDPARGGRLAATKSIN